MVKSKNEVIKIILLPYLTYLLLFFAQKIKLPVVNASGANTLFAILFGIYFLCGLCLYQLIRALEKTAGSGTVTMLLLFHIIVMILVWLLSRSGLLAYPSINTAYEISAIFLGIYCCRICRNLMGDWKRHGHTGGGRKTE